MSVIDTHGAHLVTNGFGLEYVVSHVLEDGYSVLSELHHGMVLLNLCAQFELKDRVRILRVFL